MTQIKVNHNAARRILALILSALVLLGVAPHFAVQAQASAVPSSKSILFSVPQYKNSPYTEVHGNKPYFSSNELAGKSFKKFSELDSLGRCGTAYARLGLDTLPTQARGKIGEVKPTGWHLIRDDEIDGKYVYNRCHLIAFSLSGENANEKNLITGTRYLNATGMLPFENQVNNYIRKTGNHVLYRVTPVFKENELLARGVLMEAQSVEDRGAGVTFCVYVYNVQPGYTINYNNGVATKRSNYAAAANPSSNTKSNTNNTVKSSNSNSKQTYVVNVSSKKFHKENCKSVKDIADKNKRVVKTDRRTLINQGYSPCGNCKP